MSGYICSIINKSNALWVDLFFSLWTIFGPTSPEGRRLFTEMQLIWKRNDLKAFGDAWAASVQRKATSNDVCFCSNKSVTTKSVRFREERCCFTSALPSPLTRSQLLSVMAPVQPPWRLNLFKWTTAFIWNLTQESVGITEQTCTSAKKIWRFSRQPSLL